MRYQTIDEANQAVIEKIVATNPVLLDVAPAKSVIETLNEGKVLLHAGPPILWEHMPDPIKGSCIGAVLFEGWAEDEASARDLLSQGEVTFIPCHHVQAVGPMGGITSANMPVWKGTPLWSLFPGGRRPSHLDEGCTWSRSFQGS
jgi:hypothetical protein